MKYGATIENMNLICKKAESKNNGVYSFRGVIYRVANKVVTHIASNREILERCGNFNVVIGSYNGYDSDAKKILKGM